MPHYAIGDVQGCYVELMALLDKIAFNEKNDTLWFAGDMFNGGPQNLSVLRFILHLSINSPNKPIVVLGNHDLYLLALFYGVRPLQPEDTVQDILNAPDASELINWLKKQPLAHYDAHLNYLMVHAGISPFWSLAETLTRSRAAETYLNSAQVEDTSNFLHHIFNAPHQDSNSESVFESVDTLTRIRFLEKNGTLNITYKGSIQHAPEGLYPWFNYPNASNAIWQTANPVNVLFGHWASLEKTPPPHLFALDKGCVWGEKLCALRLEDQQWFEVKGKKYR